MWKPVWARDLTGGRGVYVGMDRAAAGVILEARATATAGNYEVAGELYRAHGPHALRLAYLLTGDRGRAEDLVQEAFVRLLGRLRAIRDPEALQGYLNRTIVNLAKNVYRRDARTRAYLDRERGAKDVIEPPPAIEQRLALHSDLLTLPYRQRVALVLRYCEDMSEAAAADVLGTSPKAIRSLVGRGLATLRGKEGGVEDA